MQDHEWGVCPVCGERVKMDHQVNTMGRHMTRCRTKARREGKKREKRRAAKRRGW